MEVVRDSSTHIYASLHEINVHLVLGSILACLVVFAFMRDWRATVIAAVAIPASVVSTFGLMAALDFTLNTVTMLALVLMVGIVIDDAIVVLENIFRFIEEKGMNPFDAAREATAEIALPVLATTLCLVVIFIPVSFMSSISGRFLYQFGLTAACAILVSLLVSFTLTPMMSARMFGGRRRDRARRQATTGRHREPASISRSTWPTPPSSTWRSGAAPGGGGCRRPRRSCRTSRSTVSCARSSFPSGVDEAQFEMQVWRPKGASPAAMSDAMAAIETDVRAIPGVRLVLATVAGGPLGVVNEGQLFVRSPRTTSASSR